MTARTTTSPWTARVVWATTMVGLIAIGLSVWMSATVSGRAPTVDAVGAATSQALTLVAFLLSGAIIVARQPRNVVGWLLMVPGLGLPLTAITSAWLVSLDPPPTHVDPGLWLILWATTWSWLLLIFPVFGLLQAFPDGRLPSARWRWLVGLEVAMVVAFAGPLSALTDEMGVLLNDETVWTVPNPIGILDSEAVWSSWFDTIWSLGLLVVTVASVLAVVTRFRRGTAEERQQIKWPVLAITFFGVVYGTSSLTAGDTTEIWNILFLVAITAIPVAVAIAVLKYHLYAIDRIISRTIGWTLASGFLVIVFAVTILATQAALSSFTQGQTIAVAASTLIVFALFQPVRRRIQGAVDRRFDRARFDADLTIRGFSTRLRDDVDLDVVRGEITRTADAAVRPTAAAIWLRGESPS